MIVRERPMSVKDLVFERQLGEVRRAVQRLPKHLRPTPTWATFEAAASALGLSRTGLRKALRRRRWRTFELDGIEIVPNATIDMLRR